MFDDKAKYTVLNEGSIKRGGYNGKATMLRPDYDPPSQVFQKNSFERSFTRMEKKEFIFYSDAELDAMTDEQLEEYRFEARNFYIEVGDYYQNNVCGCWQDREYQKKQRS